MIFNYQDCYVGGKLSVMALVDFFCFQQTLG